jgi:hypothetical protein
MAGQGDDARAHALGHGNDGDQFVRRARIGNGQQDVLAGEHAEVAVNGFGRMHEKGRRAGGGQRGGDLAGDVAGFADAGDDDPARAVEDHADRLDEARVDAALQRLQGLDFDAEGAVGAGADRLRAGLGMGMHPAILSGIGPPVRGRAC